MTDLPLEIHHKVRTDDATALDILAELCDLPIDQLLRCFDNGGVWLEIASKPRRLYQADFVPSAGNQLHLYCHSSTLEPCPYRPTLIQDFTEFSAWFKPAGMLSQGSKWGDHWTLHRWVVRHQWPKRDGEIVHRLDRFTSGIMLVAHSHAMNRQLHELFEQRQVQKTYRALVLGALPVGHQFEVEEPIDGRYALSHFRVLQSDEASDRSVLEIRPQTGRKHQIRVHLANAGYPVVNDRQYGLAPFTGDLALQACGLEFTNPLNGEALSLHLDDATLIDLETDSGTAP